MDPYSFARSRARLKAEQSDDSSEKPAIAGATLKRFRKRVRKRWPVIKRQRPIEPEEILEQLKRTLQAYLAQVTEGLGNPESRVGVSELARLMGYTRSSNALHIRRQLGLGSSGDYSWREIQHRVRDLLIRNALRRLTDCL